MTWMMPCRILKISLLIMLLWGGAVVLAEEQGVSNDRPPTQEGYKFRDFYACTNKYSVPAFLGWCHRGDFYGPVHAGSMVMTLTEKDFYGFAQIGLLVSNQKSFYGALQTGLVLDTEEQFNGIAQLGLVAISGEFHGLLQVGLFNMSMRKFIGLGQIGIWNQSGKKDATDTYYIGLFQMGLINLSRYSEKVFTLQFSGLVSFSTTHYGLEAGPVNVCAKEMFGVQVGVYNHAVVMRGIQIGVYNQAETLYGLQLGILNHAGNGMLTYFPFFNIGW